MNKLTKWMDERKRSSFILMLIVGAYLYYSIYKMFQGLETLETSHTPVYIFMGVFAVGGTVLFILCLIALIGGHYKEKFELSEDEEAAEADEEAEENYEENDEETDEETEDEEDTEDASE
ncbi:MAG: hypothetical protein II635_02195 [Oscillospiraceae bacterium]|nr:hypothetical protein [Oscillospiraceae bacterium]